MTQLGRFINGQRKEHREDDADNAHATNEDNAKKKNDEQIIKRSIKNFSHHAKAKMSTRRGMWRTDDTRIISACAVCFLFHPPFDVSRFGINLSNEYHRRVYKTHQQS